MMRLEMVYLDVGQNQSPAILTMPLPSHPIPTLKSRLSNFPQSFSLDDIYNQLMRNSRIIIVLVLLQLSQSIRFNYLLPMYQMQCFHESVEKDSRYQIAIKGEKSQYYLHVVEHNPVHEDSRTENAEYKYYSAFAGDSTVITFCIGNLGESQIYFDVQFYHGIYLEDSYQSKVQGHELEDLANRWETMLKMVESNYDIYGKHLISRRATNQRITLWLAVMAASIVLGTVLIKCIFYRKIVRFMKDKKVL